MSPTPPSTTSSSAGGHSPDTQYRVVRKRNRVPLSCGPCRHRKLKCNRTHPCENCVRRGDASSCSYAAPGTRKKNQSQGSSSPDDMQNRIDRLEGLVLSLMTNGAQSAGPTAAHAAISRSASASGPSTGQTQELEQDDDDEDDDMIKEEDEDQGSDVESVSNSFGAMKVDAEKGKSMYFGDSHWHLVLADIAEVKNYFATHKRELEAQYTKVASASPSTALGGPAFLFSGHTPTTETELRAGLPGKSAVEKLVSRYFNSLDPAVYIIHYPTFHKQLNNYLQDPAQTSIVWIGLLYAVICLAMQSYSRIGDEPPEWKGRTLDLASEYRKKTVQCLVISDYTKSVENTIETLVLYVHGEYSSRWDAEVGIWVIVGMIVRLAMRMGYHRDPKHFPGISAFQSEMRRRVWSFVRQADIMFSFQLALPSAIRVGDCDAELPRNIFEDEFGPESKELPPSRPITDPTPLSYMLAKTELSYVFGEIIEEINSLSGRTATYEDVMKKDNKLRDTHANMAPHLRMRPLDECLHDPATLIIQRFHIDILYQKAMCVLHRKYIGRARQNPRYAHSRRACVEAAMEILRHQAILHRESQPGGRLRSMKWIISSLTKHDLLLGAMVVCLDLHYDSMAQQYDRHVFSPEQKADMVQALETSAAIWRESVNTSVEAFKASEILTIMLQKMKSQGIDQRAPQTNSDARTTNEVFQSFDDNLQPEHSAAMTLGMLSSGGLTPNTAALFNGSMPLTPGGTKYQMDMAMGDAGQSTGMTPNFSMDGLPMGGLNGAASPFSQVFGSGMMPGAAGMTELPLDWEAWDSYIQNGNTLDPSLQFYAPGQNNFDALNPDLTQEQQASGAFGNSVFMGANTPGKG